MRHTEEYIKREMDTDPKENTDLLNTNKDVLKTTRNGCTTHESVPSDPPDGGFMAYSVMIGSFLTNGLLFGVINSYGVIYNVLQKQLHENNVSNSESRAALVGALTMGTTFFLSPLTGVLTDLMGLRLTAVLGGAIATASLIISSFVIDNVDALCFTYGILYGLGASLAYTPSLAILGHYFKRHLGLVNGIVTIGSSAFSVIMLTLMQYMIKHHGLQWMYRVLAIFSIGISLCGLLFKPISLTTVKKASREDDSFKSLINSIINVQIWKNRKYKLWALSMPVALFGYLVPYVHFNKFTQFNFKDVSESSMNLPIQCIAATSGIGRLVFGFLADRKGIDRILLQQISFYVIGTLTIFLPFVNTFTWTVVISLGMGIFDGAFIALIGPIAFELCGSAHAAQAIGCMLGLAAVPLSLGPPVAGYLFKVLGSYTVPFVLAGISPLVGATLMFTIRCHKPRNRFPSEAIANGHVSLATSDAENPAESFREDRKQTSL